MLFHLSHVHTNDTCPGAHPEILQRVTKWWDELKKDAGVKVISGYVSPTDHSFFITLEADDNAALARAVGPLNALGAGYTSPVIPLDDAFALAAVGTFELPKA
jgi:hypothetical protein